MARIRSFIPATMTRHSVHEEVEARYTAFQDQGQTFLQIDTFGRDRRELPARKSQTVQVDANAARELHAILAKTFHF